MVQWFDTSIDWDDPAGPRPWQQAECDRFNAAALGLFAAIEAELGGKFEVINEHRDLSPYCQ